MLCCACALLCWFSVVLWCGVLCCAVLCCAVLGLVRCLMCRRVPRACGVSIRVFVEVSCGIILLLFHHTCTHPKPLYRVLTLSVLSVS